MSAMGEQMGFDGNILRPQSCPQDERVLDGHDIIVFGVKDEMRWCVCGDIEMRAVGRFEGCRCRGPDQFLAATGVGHGCGHGNDGVNWCGHKGTRRKAVGLINGVIDGCRETGGEIGTGMAACGKTHGRNSFGIDAKGRGTMADEAHGALAILKDDIWTCAPPLARQTVE